jgi:fucose 4-O-acetylase-like acetyltransferase
MFPWAAFLAFGVAAGTILKSVTADQMHRLMLWTTTMGFVVLFASQYVSNLPYNVYPSSQFWLNSPWLTLMKLGSVLILTGGAFLWTEHIVHEKWSWIKQLGTTSLLVYWVHIELVYGRWFGGWKEALDNNQVVGVSVVLIALMLGLSVLRTRLKGVPLPRWIPARAASAPRRVAGD